MEYVRSPKLPPLVFEAQTCAKDSTYVGVDVVRRRNGLANAPLPLPILCPADGVEPVDGVLGFVEGCCGKAVLPEPVAVRGARLVLEGFAGRDAGPGRLPLEPHRVGSPRGPRGRGDAAARAGAHGRRVARQGAHGQAQHERDDRPVGAQTEVVYSVRSSSSELDGAGADFSQAFAYEGGMCGTSSTRGGC